MKQPRTPMSGNGITSDVRKASARDPSSLSMPGANSDMRNNKSQADCVRRQGSPDPRKMLVIGLARAGANRFAYRRSLMGDLTHGRCTEAPIHEDFQPNRIKRVKTR